MIQAQHTPGPWVVGIDDEPTAGVPAIEIDNDKEFTKDWKSIAYVNSSLKGKHFKITATDRANARLIAAAPDLLEALEVLVLNADSYNGKRVDRVDALFDNARAAIAKARGQL